MCVNQSRPRTKLVFDPRIWGGRDRGNNEHCWQPGTLIEEYWADEHDYVADVLWPDGSITRGHFINGMKEIPHAR